MKELAGWPVSRRAWLAAPAALWQGEGRLEIGSGIPAGNIVVEGRAAGEIRVRQDLRDTEGDWFWWCFEVRGAGAETLRFRFTGSDVIGTRGPAMSADGGLTWRWLGRGCVEGKSFVYRFDPAVAAPRFAFAMPYTEADLRRFLRGRKGLRVEELCRTKKGRTAERLRFGANGGGARKVLLTARHHCCECMASYALEGLVEAALEDRWLRGHVQCAVIPFVDKDGVEDGDQGKNRRPRDHNRDYDGQSVHPTVRALREWAPEWGGGRLEFALDLHCPWIRGEHNEEIYFPGGEDQRIWAEMVKFGGILEQVERGGLPYSRANNMPFGTAWNTAANYAQGQSFARWAAGLRGVRAAGTIEIPYANCGSVDVTAESARALGHGLAEALREYLKG
ncbi:MAG: peptidase M14 [Acidobacteria bacterium]|nr:peptidase M14 [Acidobacteriota bacterium]